MDIKTEFDIGQQYERNILSNIPGQEDQTIKHIYEIDIIVIRPEIYYGGHSTEIVDGRRSTCCRFGVSEREILQDEKDGKIKRIN